MSRQMSAGLDASRVVSTQPAARQRQPLRPRRPRRRPPSAPMPSSCGRWLRNASSRSCSAADGERRPAARPAPRRTPSASPIASAAPSGAGDEQPRDGRRTGRGARPRSPPRAAPASGCPPTNGRRAGRTRAASTIGALGAADVGDDGVRPRRARQSRGSRRDDLARPASARTTRSASEMIIRSSDATSIAWRTIACSSTALRSTPITSAGGQAARAASAIEPPMRPEPDDRDAVEGAAVRRSSFRRRTAAGVLSRAWTLVPC